MTESKTNQRTLIKNKIKFLFIYSIRKFYGAVAKSYIRKGFLIYEEMRKYSPCMRRLLVIYDFATAPFLNFPIFEENLIFFFYQCRITFLGCMFQDHFLPASKASSSSRADTAASTASGAEPPLLSTSQPILANILSTPFIASHIHNFHCSPQNLRSSPNLPPCMLSKHFVFMFKGTVVRVLTTYCTLSWTQAGLSASYSNFCLNFNYFAS
jgi:hypothetical protein